MPGSNNAGKERLMAAAVKAMTEAGGDRGRARRLFADYAFAGDAIDYAASVFIGRASAPPRARGEATAAAK